MKTPKIKLTTALEEGDYFFVRHEGKEFTLTICDGERKPWHVTGITRKQLAQLKYQLAKAEAALEAEAVAAMYEGLAAR